MHDAVFSCSIWSTDVAGCRPVAVVAAIHQTRVRDDADCVCTRGLLTEAGLDGETSPSHVAPAVDSVDGVDIIARISRSSVTTALHQTSPLS